MDPSTVTKVAKKFDQIRDNFTKSRLEISENTKLDVSLTGEKHLQLLHRYIISAMSAMYINTENYDFPDTCVWFQQDGVPLHYFRPVRDSWTKDSYKVDWYNRNRRMATEISGFTPLNISLWGYLKFKYHFNRRLIMNN